MVCLANPPMTRSCLTQGSGDILTLGNLWNGFIAALVLFFAFTIVDQVRSGGAPLLVPSTAPRRVPYPLHLHHSEHGVLYAHVNVLDHLF